MSSTPRPTTEQLTVVLFTVGYTYVVFLLSLIITIQKLMCTAHAHPARPQQDALASSSNPNPKKRPFVHKSSRNEFAAGYVSAMVDVLITYPLSKLIFRQQLYGLRMQPAVRQLTSEGFVFLYRGILPPLMQKSTTRCIMFGMYDTFTRLLNCQSSSVSGLDLHARRALAAALAGTTEAVLCPLERVQTLLQTRAYHDHYRNTFHALLILRNHGYREYFRGISVIVTRNALSNVVFFSLRGPIRNNVPANMGGNTAVADFWAGATLGAVISTTFFPFNVVKTRIQSTVGTEYATFLQTARIVWAERHRSLKRLFRGVHVNYTRSFLSWGIINMAYESIDRYLRNVSPA